MQEDDKNVYNSASPHWPWLEVVFAVLILLVAVFLGWLWFQNANPAGGGGPNRSNIFDRQLVCMTTTQRACSYSRCDHQCPNGAYTGFTATDKQINPDGLLYQRIEKTGLCPPDATCKGTTTVYMDGQVSTGDNSFQLTPKQRNEVANIVSNAPNSLDQCSKENVMDVSTRYRLARPVGGIASTTTEAFSLPQDGQFIAGTGCKELRPVRDIISDQANQATTTTSGKPADVQKEIGTTTDQVVGGFYVDIGNSIDKITVDQSSLPVSPEEFPSDGSRLANSAHNLIKVYQDGSRESVPFALQFCPPYTDVCRSTAEVVDLSGQDYRADITTPIQFSVREVRIKINNTLAKTIERPQQPPKITSISKTKLDDSQLKRRLTEDEYQDLNTKQGTLIEWTVEKGSFQSPQVVALHRADSDREDLGWSVGIIENLVAGTMTQPSKTAEFLVTEDTITSGSGKFDFKLRVSDGFHLVTAEKKDFFSKPLNPIGLGLASPPMVYLRTPFFITIDEFTDPIGGNVTDKRTIFYERGNGITYPSERRSAILSPEYRVEWSSQTLPLETVAKPIRKDPESPVGLRIDIPRERRYTDLVGSHTVKATVTHVDRDISQAATTTLELVPLSEACSSENALIKRACPTTTEAE
jgi:Trp operon repressor